MPAPAARPVPTMMAVGVANPRAQGQAMISTATAVCSAMVSRWSAGARKYQATKVTRASTRTTGTKIPATRSANFWIGALLPWACCTRRTICCSTVSLPTLVARMRKEPVLFSVAPITGSPGLRTTGSGSPVSMLSSTADEPSMTTPSTGTFSPGRTRTTSPTRTSSIGSSPSLPSRSTRAVRGCKAIRARILPRVRLVARA